MSSPRHNVIIMSGAPGVGKTTLLDTLRAYAGKHYGLSIESVSANDSFMEDGEYRFVQELLPQAHAKCFHDACERMRTLPENTLLAIDNCHLNLWDLTPYAQLAKAYGSDGRVPVLVKVAAPLDFDGSNIHGVPLKRVLGMVERGKTLFVHENFVHVIHVQGRYNVSDAVLDQILGL